MRKALLTILAVLLLAVVGFAGTLGGMYDIPVMVEKPVVVEPLPDETPSEDEKTDENENEKLPEESNDETGKTEDDGEAEVPATELVATTLGLYLTEKLHFTGFLNAVGEGLYKTIFFIISTVAAVLFGVTLVFIFKRKRKAPENPNPPVYPPNYQERKGPKTVDRPKSAPKRGVKF